MVNNEFEKRFYLINENFVELVAQYDSKYPISNYWITHIV